MKTPLFSVTRDDCDWSTFKGSGPGGQHRNKVETAVRCVHRASGAVGQASDDRSQYTNRQLAFHRMAETKEFQLWLKLETGRQLGKPSVDELVDAAMSLANLKIEVRDETGKWETVK